MSLTVYLYENCCDACGRKDRVYRSNVTHNLVPMAVEADIYKPLWRPDEIGITKASEVLAALEKGYADIRARPEHYKKFAPTNGWGSYEGFVIFLSHYMAGCNEHPNAIVEADR